MKDLKGKEFKSFHVHHEASMLELFFNLFLVANLATFTAYHEITTSGTVAAYIGLYDSPLEQLFNLSKPDGRLFHYFFTILTLF